MYYIWLSIKLWAIVIFYLSIFMSAITIVCIKPLEHQYISRNVELSQFLYYCLISSWISKTLGLKVWGFCDVIGA